MSDTKQQILDTLAVLPEEQQQRLLDFVRRLQSHAESSPIPSDERTREDAPIARAIGSIDCDPIGDRIDEELYGS